MKKGKKGAEVEEQVLLGKVGTHLTAGIVGLPNVGKSSLFNILTKMGIPAENFPFCTIDPHTSRVFVPDERFDFLCESYQPKKKERAFLEITDIAGLVKGASKGEGLGNAFLANIKACDGIFQVVRLFPDEDVTHVEGNIDPVRDLDIISEELRAKDTDFMETQVISLEKEVARKDKTKAKDLAAAQKVQALLQEGKDVRDGIWTAHEVLYINTLQLITAKPIIYLANMNRRDYIRKKNKFLKPVFNWIKQNGNASLIPFCVELEEELLGFSAEEMKAWEEENKSTSAISKIIKQGFSALRLIYFFTAGADEVKCWTVTQGFKAPQAAGVIHTDFEKTFICAEVMTYPDFVECGATEQKVKEAGKYRQQGKNYVVGDGDIIYFKTGAARGGKK